MPLSNYLKFTIKDQQVDLEARDAFPIAISYRLEDQENFQNKKSSEALNISIPATGINSKIANTFFNPAVDDNTVDDSFTKPVKCILEANGQELFIGKAFLKSASHTDQPVNFLFDCFGDNADWIIDLKDATLYDFIKHITFTFNVTNIQNSWDFDGTSEALPYVFAPVRYRASMQEYPASLVQNPPPMIQDFNMKPEYMKPSISVYWIIYWAFKSLGYKLQSNFFDSNYFRRATMPWTWGNFIFSEGTKQENLKFLAKSTEQVAVANKSFTGYLDVKATNETVNGAFDNTGVYSYNTSTFEMVWTYLSAYTYGLLNAHMHISVFVNATATANSDVELRVRWFKNGVQFKDQLLVELNAPAVGRRDYVGQAEDYIANNVSPGDTISAKIYLHTFDSGLGRANITVEVDTFELEFLEVVLGSTVDFANYTSFKKYKFLDFLRGVIDSFNLEPNTDPINKVVIMEPTHPYPTGHDQSVKIAGYFNDRFLDWDAKQDLSKLSEVILESEGERELVFKFKDDSNDGMVKILQDRNQITIGSSKYVLPERFKTGQKEVPNRFFTPVVHYDVPQWSGLSTNTPQMICLVPENISNTSQSESENTFGPKLTWYKGLAANTGWKFNGLTQTSFPFMFAVNYTPGGQNDPIFSYCDEKIGNETAGFVVGVGLLKRFFIQRMATLRHGKTYKSNFHLNNYDVTNWFHREHKIVGGQKWELVEITDYRPLLEQSTPVVLRKVAPILATDVAQVFPSTTAVNTGVISSSNYDMKYSALKCLPSDIPK